jgi:hypothetical protein
VNVNDVDVARLAAIDTAWAELAAVAGAGIVEWSAAADQIEALRSQLQHD